MKQQTLDQLKSFETSLRTLKREIKALQTERVSKVSIRESASTLANVWIEELQPVLSTVFKIPSSTLSETTDNVIRLMRLTRPNNRVSSYLEVIDLILRGFKDKYVLPIQQSVSAVKGIPQLHTLLEQLTNLDETNYIT